VSIDVEIESVGFFGRSFTNEGSGTGIILSADGIILTNKHVIGEEATEVVVGLSDGTELTDVEILGRDPFNDIAYLKVNGVDDLTPAPLGDSAGIRVGDQVIAIGNALGQFENTVTSGIISGSGRPIVAGGSGVFDEPDALQNLFQTDASINPGNSGGPLVSLSGEVIGVNTAVAGNAENIGFAIPINDVKSGIESVFENGRLVKPYLGVRYTALTDSIAEEFGLDTKRGAYIFSSSNLPAVLDDSPAQRAGLQSGDIITRIGSEAIDERNSLVFLVGKSKVGETISLTVMRDGEEITLDVVLEEVPENF
ncbi:MAG: trypsin-like peptidase domain-containing protein, partial [Candidatus Saccharimonadales bacterium]|nr:trypsin-like peptidase domain-containing protein [Candidatus Saccharimonadales bacterium]